MIAEMGPLSKFNKSTLIREVNSSLDLFCRSNNNSSLLIKHCVDGICSNITTIKGQGSEVVVRFLSLKTSDSGTYICRELPNPSGPLTTIILKVGGMHRLFMKYLKFETTLRNVS